MRTVEVVSDRSDETKDDGQEEQQQMGGVQGGQCVRRQKQATEATSLRSVEKESSDTDDGSGTMARTSSQTMKNIYYRLSLQH